MKVDIKKSTRDDKRYQATFTDDSGKKSTTHFGYAEGNKTGSTFIDHKNKDKKEAWTARHKVRGTFNDYKSASSLAYHILWNKPTLQESIKDYKKRFNLS